MAIMDHRFASQSSGFFSSLASSLKNSLMTIQHYFIARKTILELEKLSDRELDDVGLHRGNIREAVKGFVHKN